MFDKENASYSADNYVKNNNGEEIYNAGSGYTTSFIKVKPNTNYNISGKITTNDLGGRIYFYDINKSWLSRSNSFSGINVDFTFSTPADCNYIQFSYIISAFDSNTVQVEESSTATDYVEHKEQTFTFPLGNEKLMLGDYLADDGIHHVRKQTEITENNINLVYNATSQFGVNCANIRKDALGYKTAWGSRYCLINKYSEISTVQEVRSGTFGTVFDQIYLRIFDDRFTDTETAKQLLIGTIIEILLAEEVIVPYTSAQKEVYNQIKQSLSYEEQTNIRGSSNGSNPIFSVEGYQSTKLVLKEMATAIVALGGV